MNNLNKSKREFKALCHEVVNCRCCFKDKKLKVEPPTKNDTAQPRWIGPNYWTSKPRILIILINPGAGKGRKDAADDKARKARLEFSKNPEQEKLNNILKDQREDMTHWGVGNQHFFNFYRKMGLQGYIDESDLEKDKIAFANIAWCAAWCETGGNQYPSEMLNTCYDKHTKKLLKIIKPDIIILSGSATHRFCSEIHKVIPASNVITTFHYANRESDIDVQTEQARVKKQIQGIMRRF